MVEALLRHPKTLLGLALFVAGLALAVAWERLGFSADRSELLARNNPAQRRYRDARERFQPERDVLLLVLCSDAEVRDAATRALGRELQPLGETLTSLDLPNLPQQGLFFLEPSRLHQLESRLDSLAHALRTGDDPQSLDSNPRLRQLLVDCLRSGGRIEYVSPFGEPPPTLPTSRPLLLGSRAQLLLCSPELAPRDGVPRVRAAVERVLPRFAGVRVVAAGDYLVGYEDANRSIRSALQAALCAVIWVHLFFRLAFGRSRPPRLALLCLLVGLAWSLGWVVLVAPTLNLVTVNFPATLVGLGMDFAIGMLYRYEELRRHQPLGLALQGTLLSVGKENLIGAGATALAFASLSWTDFASLAELGRICAGGVLLCWLASVTVLPALLVLTDPAEAAGAPRWDTWVRWERNLRERPGRLVLLGLVLTMVALPFSRRPQFHGDLLAIQPLGSAAVEADRAFHASAGMCPLSAVSLCKDEDTLRRRARQFAALPSVARVECPLLALPPSDPRRIPVIQRLVKAIAQLPPLGHPPEPAGAEELLRLRHQFGARLGLGKLGPGPAQDGLLAFRRFLYDDLQARLRWLRAQKSEPVPDWSQLPPAWQRRYRSPDGVWQLRIYSRLHLWDPARCAQFLADLRSVDPNVTGMPVITDLFLQSLHQSLLQAARNALLAIFVLLWISLRSLRRALLTLLPKLVAMLWTLGAMGALGLNFNPVNGTSLPLMLGIGLVFSVHVLHRQVEAPNEELFAGSTGPAVLVSGVSTLLGYAALLLVPHRGMMSLGLVMALGLSANLIAALVFFPALLRLRR